MSKRAIGRLHVITDEVLQTRYSHAELARLAVAGGADAVQLREKRHWTTRQLIEAAVGVSEACGDAALFVVDDRADVAAAVGAPALHLGRDDVPADVARRLLGRDALIGGTANSIEEALRVARTPIDYMGVGPVYGTRSKANPAPDMGLDTLRTIVEAVGVPVIAIGSITPDRVGEVMATGVYGVAVLSGVVCQDDVTAAARAYVTEIETALGERGESWR